MSLVDSPKRKTQKAWPLLGRGTGGVGWSWKPSMDSSSRLVTSGRFCQCSAVCVGRQIPGTPCSTIFPESSSPSLLKNSLTGNRILNWCFFSQHFKYFILRFSCLHAFWELGCNFFLINLFIFGCVGSSLLCAGFSLVAAGRGYSSLWCTGFSLQWLLLLQSTGCRSTGFSSCGMQAQ